MADSQLGKVVVSESLEAIARQLAGRPLSQEERRQQRISFVMGMVGSDHGITRDFVERLIDRTEDGQRA